MGHSMKETIEAWAVMRDGIQQIFRTESEAITYTKHWGGTVVRLTGEMPRPLRKVSTEVWIQPMKPIESNSPLSLLQFRLGIKDWNPENKEKCTIRARITMQELSDDES